MTKIKPIFRRLDNVSLKKIHLDPLNPRHDPLDDENEIIAQLYKQEYILALAKDIVAKGTLNPLDSTGVIEMDDNPGHYIVVEGTSVPKMAQETREWNSSQKARYAETESPDQLALAVLDRAEGAGWIDAGQRKQLAITTLTSKPHPDNRKYLMPTDFVIHHRDKSLLRLRQELRSSPVDDHEFSVNYLLRAFVERVMVLYAKHCKVHQPKMSDQRLVQVCVEALGKDGVSASDLKSMRVAMSDENASHSLHTLGAAVHTGHLPTRKSLIAAWDNWKLRLG
ncbi:UNVERIFIED_CONTAM: hypothetical protein K2H54_000159 [Gekko kuhli]